MRMSTTWLNKGVQYTNEVNKGTKGKILKDNSLKRKWN